ncbi:hypothetical protein BJ742DRAFT_845539 [Cladochytrium replicatum]|nr:hypothetical protein BJ742DRAFT_845539 [Cladochytrium replicatum]
MPPEKDVFDLVIPSAIAISIVSIVIGPVFFPLFHSAFLLAYFSAFFLLSCSHMFKFSLAFPRVLDTIARANDVESKGLVVAEIAHLHLFVLPNYCEPLQLLRKTVARLGSHRAAKTNYVIVMAMEEREAESVEKARALREEFEDSFKDFLVTFHPPNIPGESAGKGSNVNYAVRTACGVLSRKGIPMKQMMVTVSDADSGIPELYISCLERAAADAVDPYSVVYCPPIFFSRNAFSVPAPVRATDIMWSIMHLQNLANPRGLMFAASNYSLSMVLADKVGYWDTDFASIGEDMHMGLKCFFKTEGAMRMVPIYVPINQANVQTTGWFENIKARYVQAKRHYFGVADTAYALRNAARAPSNPQNSYNLSFLLDRIQICWLTLEAHIVPTTAGWLMMAAVPMFEMLRPGLFDVANYGTEGGLSALGVSLATAKLWSNMWFAAKVMSTLGSSPLLINAFMYEYYHRRIERDLLKKEAGPAAHGANHAHGTPRRMLKQNTGASYGGTGHQVADNNRPREWRYLSDFLWLGFSALIFMTVPSTEAAIRAVVRGSKEKYVVAQKMVENEDD